MKNVYGVAIRKGGQGKSTTVSNLARLAALSGARILVVDLAQPGTTTASLRDIWPDGENGETSNLLLTLRGGAPQTTPHAEIARAALQAERLPVQLASQPSWSGGYIHVLPWDESLAESATFVQSPHVLMGILDALEGAIDIVLIDLPGEGGALLTMAMAATQRVIMPLTPETPALEGAHGMLRLMAQTREAGHTISLGGIILTRCDPKNKRMFDVVQALFHANEVEGEPVSRRLFPFAIRHNEFFEQAFRYGEPIWDRTANPSHWAGYVLLAEWLLRDAGFPHLADPRKRRGPAVLSPDTRILDVSNIALDPEVAYADFQRAHPVANG